MIVRLLIGLLSITLLGCAAQSPPASALAKPSPEVERRVRQQIASLQSYCEVTSVERTAVAEGEQGWRITYRQIDQTLGGPRTTEKWMELGDEGFIVGMSPVVY